METQNSFTIYDASAGSGKTFTLVKEYLLLLFSAGSNDAFKNILAITFTNKAVAEMKSRIIETLTAFSAEECPPKHIFLLQLISEETGFSEEETQAKSRQILKSIMQNYAAFEISTIDGFTHRVLRTFAKDLKLPINFEVELNTSEVLQKAVDNLINKAGEDKKLTRVLIDFALTKADDDKSWDISRDLFEIATLLTKETNRKYLKQLKHKNLEDFELFSKNLKENIQLLKKETSALADTFFELIEANGLEEKDFSGSYCPKFFRRTQKGFFEENFEKKWQMELSEAPLYPQRIADYKKEVLDELQPQIAALFLEVRQNSNTIHFFEAVQKKLVPLSLLKLIQEELETIKKERSILLISEFNAIISETVKEEPAPFIYERLGERYNHYFIDEFQDTSQLQWQNLIPLISHTLDTGHPEGEHGSLRIVGDAKQSIYRWRGGKAEQFIDLCKGNHPFTIKENLMSLPHNYRSTGKIVDFNNEFFNFSSQFFASPEHKLLFEKTSAQNAIHKDGGYINLSFVEAENVAEEMQVYPEKILAILQELEQKHVPKKDICILTRRKKEGVAIANFLSEHNIPLISAESLLLCRSPKVNFIAAVLQFSTNSDDSYLKLQVLEFLLQHSVEIDNEFQFISEKILLDQESFFKSLEPFGAFFNLNLLSDISIYEAVEYIIRSFNLVEGSDAYVQFYLDFVYEYSQKENAGIFDFLELWEQKKESLSIVAPQGEDAVQIMTIHKAKGLEFPVVIYPFANSKIKDIARESLWISLPEPLNTEMPVSYMNVTSKMQNWGEEASFLYNELCCNSQLDALNVLYVAMTRPVQQLYIISTMDLDSKGNEKMNQISGLFIAFLKEKNLWNGSLEYEFGNPDQFFSEEITVEKALQQDKFYSSALQGSAVSIVTKSGSLWNSKQEKAIEKGHLIHQLFAGINTSKDLGPVLENAKKEGLVRNEEEAEIKKMLLEVITHPELELFYSGAFENYNERDIISEDGSVLRPDRIHFSGKNISIIDYKTGEHHPGHENQVNNYAKVLSGMGFSVEKKILIYLNEEIKVQVV